MVCGAICRTFLARTTVVINMNKLYQSMAGLVLCCRTNSTRPYRNFQTICTSLIYDNVTFMFSTPIIYKGQVSPLMTYPWWGQAPSSQVATSPRVRFPRAVRTPAMWMLGSLDGDARVLNAGPPSHFVEPWRPLFPTASARVFTVIASRATTWSVSSTTTPERAT